MKKKRRKITKTKLHSWSKDLERITYELRTMEIPNETIGNLQKRAIENLTKVHKDVNMMLLNPFFKDDKETYMYAVFIAEPDNPHLAYIESSETASDFKSKKEAAQRIVEWYGKYGMWGEWKHAKDICTLGVTHRNGRLLHPNTEKMRNKADRFLAKCIKQLEEEEKK